MDISSGVTHLSLGRRLIYELNVGADPIQVEFWDSDPKSGARFRVKYHTSVM